MLLGLRLLIALATWAGLSCFGGDNFLLASLFGSTPLLGLLVVNLNLASLSAFLYSCRSLLLSILTWVPPLFLFFCACLLRSTTIHGSYILSYPSSSSLPCTSLVCPTPMYNPSETWLMHEPSLTSLSFSDATSLMSFGSEA